MFRRTVYTQIEFITFMLAVLAAVPDLQSAAIGRLRHLQVITCRPFIHDPLHPYMIKVAEGSPHSTLPPLILRRYNFTIAALNVCPVYI